MPTRNSEHLDALSRVPRKVRQYAFAGLAGCVVQRRSRQTGTLVGVYRNDQAGMNTDCLSPWSAVCEDHGQLVAFDTLKLAMWHLPDPSGWCEGCRAKAEPDPFDFDAEPLDLGECGE